MCVVFFFCLGWVRRRRDRRRRWVEHGAGEDVFFFVLVNRGGGEGVSDLQGQRQVTVRIRRARLDGAKVFGRVTQQFSIALGGRPINTTIRTWQITLEPQAMVVCMSINTAIMPCSSCTAATKAVSRCPLPKKHETKNASYSGNGARTGEAGGGGAAAPEGP